MSLAQNIHTLTRPHLPEGATLDTSPVPSLLDQLAAAVTPNNDGGTADGSGGKPSPINAGAVDIDRTITNQAIIDLWDMRGITLAKPRTLTDVIQAFDPPIDAEWYNYLEHVTLDWCDQIRALLFPTKPRRRMHQECPSCGLLFADDKHTPALSMNCWDITEAMMHPSRWDASCSACGAEWHGDELQALAPELSTDKRVDLSTSRQSV